MKNLKQYMLTLCILVFMYGCGSYTTKDNNLTKVLLSTKEVIINLENKISKTEAYSLKRQSGKIEQRKLRSGYYTI